MNETIEVMTLDDFEEVQTVWHAVAMWPHPGEGYQWFQHALLRNPEGGYVCRKDGQIIGTVLAGWDGFRGSIFHLAVLEAYRGLGIGSRLLQTAESYLKDLGVFQINLMVREGNDLAESLYYRRGYERSPVKVLRKRFSEEQLLQLAGK